MKRGTACEWCGYLPGRDGPHFDGVRWGPTLVVAPTRTTRPRPGGYADLYLCSDHLLAEHASAGCAAAWRAEETIAGVG